MVTQTPVCDGESPEIPSHRSGHRSAPALARRTARRQTESASREMHGRIVDLIALALVAMTALLMLNSGQPDVAALSACGGFAVALYQVYSRSA